jgi:hypothetical protein
MRLGVAAFFGVVFFAAAFAFAVVFFAVAFGRLLDDADDALDFVVPFADALRFVPMNFRIADHPAFKFNSRLPLQLPPLARPVIPGQPLSAIDAVTSGYQKNLCNWADYLEWHRESRPGASHVIIRKIVARRKPIASK